MLAGRLKAWERTLRDHYNSDLSTPENRRRARIYNLWFDHAILRGIWKNQHEITPGVWRSNHPTEHRLKELKAKGIQTILTLRGDAPTAHFLTEQEMCTRLDLPLHSIALNARAAPPQETILDLIKTFRQIEKPFVMHCKSGADRSGFAAAIYLMVIENASVSSARQMLSPRYLHFRLGRSAILDHILDCFEDSQNPDFENWVRTDYDPDAVERSFAAL